MPDTDGYELVRRVRVRHPSLPAVAVSAYARPEDRRSAINAGYDAACAKPIETTKLTPHDPRTAHDVVASRKSQVPSPQSRVSRTLTRRRFFTVRARFFFVPAFAFFERPAAVISTVTVILPAVIVHDMRVAAESLRIFASVATADMAI